ALGLLDQVKGAKLDNGTSTIHSIHYLSTNESESKLLHTERRRWHWEQSIVSKRWKCRAMGSICLIFGLVSRNYFYTSPCSVLARLLAAVAELGVLEGTADKASSSSEGLFPWVKEGAALTYGLVYLHFH
ncbi:hypothetical protein ACJX0J_002998, partial (mitochondrion) [Zea mays]